MVLVVNKPLGVTSYDVIRDLKKKYLGQKIGHAGTLDPLAEGVLICLIGSDTKRQHEFMSLDKEYEFEVLFGFKTDTFDILGKVLEVTEYDVDKFDLSDKHKRFEGNIQQVVPSFSAVKVRGKPLYRHSLGKSIQDVALPVREVEIKRIEHIETRTVTKLELKNEIFSLVSLVKSGFRQKEILEIWSQVFTETKQEKYFLAKFRAVVSKGTYVRAIADDLGRNLKVGAITLKIFRLKVGNYSLTTI